jgi:acyl-CoA thioesterase
MTPLAEASTPIDGALVIPAGWRQGRGAFGGLTIAAAIRAIEARVADPQREVRSVTAELPGPTLVGPVAVEVDVLRAGSSVTVARATLRQGGEVTTHAVAVLASSRPLADPMFWRTSVRPEAPAWRAVEPLRMTGAEWPEFAQHFEYRMIAGLPGSGGEPIALGWVRPRIASERRDAGYIAALADSWWPGLLARMTEPRPIATIAYTLEIIDGAAGLDRDAPWLYRGSVTSSSDGYFQETRELWGEDGRLIAVNHQTLALIK